MTVHRFQSPPSPASYSKILPDILLMFVRSVFFANGGGLPVFPIARFAVASCFSHLRRLLLSPRAEYPSAFIPSPLFNKAFHTHGGFELILGNTCNHKWWRGSKVSPFMSSWIFSWFPYSRNNPFPVRWVDSLLQVCEVNNLEGVKSK